MTDPRSAAKYAAQDAVRELTVGRLDAARNSLLRSLARLDDAIAQDQVEDL